MFVSLITVGHVFICLFLIMIVLLQQGKGADAGATFGGGGNTFFGASGADNLLTRVTTFTAIAFMCTSIFLAISTKDRTLNEGDLIQDLPETAPIEVPAPAANSSEPVEGTVEETAEQSATESAPASQAAGEAAAPQGEAGPIEAAPASEAEAPAAAPAPAAEEATAQPEQTAPVTEQQPEAASQ